MKRVSSGAESARARRSVSGSSVSESGGGAGACILRELGAKILAMLVPQDGSALLSVLMLEASRNERDPVVSAAYRTLALKYEAAIDAVARRPADLVTVHRAFVRAVRDACSRHSVPEYLRGIAYDADEFVRMACSAMAITQHCLPAAARAAVHAHVKHTWDTSTACTKRDIAYMAHYVRALFEHGERSELATCWKLLGVGIEKACNMTHRITLFLIYHHATAAGVTGIADAALGVCERMGAQWVCRRVFESVAPRVARCTSRDFWRLGTQERMLLAYVCCVTGDEQRVRQFATDAALRSSRVWTAWNDVFLCGDLWHGLGAIQLDAIGTLLYADYQKDPNAFEMLPHVVYNIKCTKNVFRVIARIIYHEYRKEMIVAYASMIPEEVILGVFDEQCIEYSPLDVVHVRIASGECVVGIESMVFVYSTSKFADDEISRGAEAPSYLCHLIGIAQCPHLFVFNDNAHRGIVQSGVPAVIDAYCRARADDPRVQQWLCAGPSRAIDAPA